MKNKNTVKRALFVFTGLLCLSVSVNWRSCGPWDCVQVYEWTLTELEQKAPNAKPGRHCGDYIGVDLITPAEEDYLDADCFARISAAVKSNKKQHPFIIKMYGCKFKLKDTCEVSSEAFKNCYNLSGLYLPDQITDIGARAFENCTNLDCLGYLNNLHYIGPNAFKGTALDENTEFGFYITFPEFESGIISPDSENSIIKNVSVTFPDDAEEKPGADCFAKAAAVISRPEYAEKSFTLYMDSESIYKEGEDISIVSESAFENCSTLKEIHLPETVTSIESCAFKNCSKLERVYRGEIKIKHSIYNCTVAPDAFEGCPLMQ